MSKLKSCPITGHLLGDARVDTHFAGPNGWPCKRVPIAISFDKTEAVLGETVTVKGVPARGHLMYKNEITMERSFVMEGESILVSLVGRYVGSAKCIRVTEETLRERMLQEAMRKFFSATPEGKAILEATSVEQLRKIK